MTQEELNKIPEASALDNLGAIFVGMDDPIQVMDLYGVKWEFATRMSDGAKVKVRVL